MQLKFLKQVTSPVEGVNKINGLAWSPNCKKLAVSGQDKVVYVYDENGERKDKFSTKAGDSAAGVAYQVRGMAFSPDSTKLAIAQSDSIVFVYKLGADWGEKKSICNKFMQSSRVTSLCWPGRRHQECVFGLLDGKVRLGQLRNNKSATLYEHPNSSSVVSLTAAARGNAVLSGHLDGSLYYFSFDGNGSQGKLAQHSCVPTAIAWGESIVAAGGDYKVVFYDTAGNTLQFFDHSGDENLHEFSSASFNPTGETVVVGSYNKFYIYRLNRQRGLWEEHASKNIDNMYTITKLAWKPDGSKLSVGGLCGNVDLYDACIKRIKYKGKFEFTYVSLSQVIVKRLSTGTRITLTSSFGLEILRINIKDDQYLTAYTAETLLLGDMESCKLSEIPWRGGTGNEKFIFENPTVCMVYNAGELNMVEYGKNDILGVCRTEHITPHLISVRLNESAAQYKRTIAYLIDLQTICILDLNTGVTLATIQHEHKIDWLELNPQGTHLLFRNKKCRLHLYKVETQQLTTMLEFCKYAQWVPDSDVVVAQGRDTLCVWYAIDTPEKVTTFPIKGEIEDIERSEGKTEVIVNEGMNTVSYALDEALIGFGYAIQRKDYQKAISILSPLQLTGETQTMWQQLSALALQEQQFEIAEQCYAILGNVAKSRYLHKVNKLMKENKDPDDDGTGSEFLVRVQLAALNQQWQTCESLYLDQGKFDDAIQLYTDIHKWQEALSLSERTNHPEHDSLKENFYQWLLQTGQEIEAGDFKEKEGDHLAAINIYLNGDAPTRAANAFKKMYNSRYPGQYDQGVFENILDGLQRLGLHEKIGQFLEHFGHFDRALNAYREGHAYKRATDLCRREFPSDVVRLEEEWGDWLVKQRQSDSAVNHFIEAGQAKKAIEAALASRQWSRVAEIAYSLDREVARDYYYKIAKHYESCRNYTEAEKFFVQAGVAQEAVDMYASANHWEAAHRIAAGYMSKSEVQELYAKRGRELEAASKFKEAEKMYLASKAPELAIDMYKSNSMFEQMIRLVSVYKKEDLAETHKHLAQEREAEGMLKQAEHHFVEGKFWKNAVQMYRARGMWDDAIRVAKLHGGSSASKQVAFAWAVHLGGDEGTKLLQKFGLVEQAIDYALENGAFEHAFDLAHNSRTSQKLLEVHLKYAMFLEDEGRFKEAEDEFLKAEKPREAIDMYLHQHEWGAAMRVAENFDMHSVPEIFVANGRVLAEQKDFANAEAMFLKGKDPELAMQMYREVGLWEDAIRVAEIHAPNRVSELQRELKSSVMTKSNAGVQLQSLISQGQMLERSGQFIEAIEIYLDVPTDASPDLSKIEQLWTKAVSLAQTHVPQKSYEVVDIVASRLMEISRHERACDMYMSCGLWNKALGLASTIGPDLVDYVEHHKRSQDSGQGMPGDQFKPSAGSIGSSGDLYGQLELCMNKEDWKKVEELAAQSNDPQLLAGLAAQHAQTKLQQGLHADAAFILSKFEVNLDDLDLLELYRQVALEVLASPKHDKRGEDGLFTLLFRIVEGASPAMEASVKDEFSKLLEAAHYTKVMGECRQAGLHQLAAKQATSLLRYIGAIPADKAFYEAGTCMKEAGELNMAFVFLNRYLDLTEAMDDAAEQTGDQVLDNGDFVNTDIPYDFHLPSGHFLDEVKREEVRDWVLTVSMDQQVDQSLSLRTCANCGIDTYAASLKCHSCGSPVEACIITGYPIPLGEKVSPTGQPAQKEDWNTYILKFKKCPWTGSNQNPIY
ncbi:intraflagellar transport protein [Chloropicon primus]|uniref:Intraflagellar transport protein n=1 Tax=Chloropicon primus TaxID=1764295 RepID=A0A5B8MSU8_9CHLO|nr:intraflagellar transport protein [Chloropicon primus]UPR02648.1 intraflagellar transport protein [Chloropicon primus]|eukprot:QDZ23436.1 intraflagellar transport protein [Chloropicon primus]